MKAQLSGPDRKAKSSVAVSLAIHVVLLAALGTLTFHYPIAEIFRRPKPEPIQTLRFIRVAPEPVASSGGGPAIGRSRSRPAARAAAMPTLSSVPVGIPAPSVPTAPSGVGAGVPADPGPVAIGTGLRPGVADPRLVTNPLALGRLPETDAQKAQRALADIYDRYLDSARAALANPGRKAGDWSWGGDKGDKWGWDENGIHIGGISIPNAVLAALPLNVPLTGSNMNALVDGRTQAYKLRDVKEHGDVMSEDEFRAAVKRIRDRVDRERAEKMAKKKAEPPCCS